MSCLHINIHSQCQPSSGTVETRYSGPANNGSFTLVAFLRGPGTFPMFLHWDDTWNSGSLNNGLLALVVRLLGPPVQNSLQIVVFGRVL